MFTFFSASFPISMSTLIPYLISFIILLFFVEQISYLLKKRNIPGPSLVLPFIGNAIPLVRNPTKFWEQQATFSYKLGFSANYIIGRFILFIRDSELSHQIFANVRPEAFLLIGHPFGKRLFGEHNLIYMFDQDHKDLRRRIAPNFTPRALSTYLDIQQRIIVQHLKKWDELSRLDSRKPISLRLLVRDLNLETSQTVMVGPYLNLESKERFKFDYNLFNVGLMKLPIDLPGFAFRNARLAVDRLSKTLADCTKQSKSRMSENQEPICLVDFWMQETVKDIAAAVSAGEPTPSYTSDAEIGCHLFDFLFAAQDASTSSLLWAVTLLESHPDVLSKVRAEISAVWSPESGKLLAAEQVRDLKYTHMVAREIVRYRAPATLVPHIAVKDFPLTENYTIPKGTIVFPSVYESSFQGFTEPDRFDPDRFNEDRQEDQLYKRNFLAFGAGAHQCVGQRYALNHLVLFVALFVSLFDFKRDQTDGCDDIVYNPTICPKDGCTVFLCSRYSELQNIH